MKAPTRTDMAAPKRVVVLAKKDRFSSQAIDIARSIFGNQLVAFSGAVGDPLPQFSDKPDVLMSFLSPWIVPQWLLDRSKIAINFHPGSADYPGTGCYNFALYDGATEFGAVCHHMLAKVDTGALIEERRFPLFRQDSVETLKLRTMVSMFHDTACIIAEGGPLPEADKHWSRRPFTRRELYALKELRPTMPPREIARRVRATTYPGYPGPFMMVDGNATRYPVPDRPALA